MENNRLVIINVNRHLLDVVHRGDGHAVVEPQDRPARHRARGRLSGGQVDEERDL